MPDPSDPTHSHLAIQLVSKYLRISFTLFDEIPTLDLPLRWIQEEVSRAVGNKEPAPSKNPYLLLLGLSKLLL